MNAKVMIYFLGKVCRALGFLQLCPLLLALYYGEDCSLAFFASAALAFATAKGCQRYGQRAEFTELSVREGIGTIFFAWLLAAVLAGVPYCLTGLLYPLDAFFESMSGLTTTGATVITDLDAAPRTLLFWRTLTCWAGGIGGIILFVVLLPQLAGSSAYLFNADGSGISSSRILPRLQTTAVALFYIYLLLTIILTGVLSILGLDTYDAMLHACSALATGGFSPYNDSVAHFQSTGVELALGIFMVLAAGNFAVYYQITQSGLRSLKQDPEFRAYLLLLGGVTLLISANIIIVQGYSVGDALLAAFFQVASFGSTTGLVTADYDQWPTFSKLLLGVLILVGGCAGSPAGGVKISRCLVLLKGVAMDVRRTLHPQLLFNVYYNKRYLPTQMLINISRFFFLYILLIGLLMLPVANSLPSAEQALFAVASCMGNVGPAFGELGPGGTYAQIGLGGKLALLLAMLLGRLELFTVLVLLRREYWRRSRRW